MFFTDKKQPLTYTERDGLPHSVIATEVVH